MELSDAKKRLLAAQTLLFEPASSFEKFRAVHELISGLDPRLDHVFTHARHELDRIEPILGSDFVMFAAENLPENTDRQKRRKEAVLYFREIWNALREEVEQTYMEEGRPSSSDRAQEFLRHWMRIIFSFATGPIGILAILAIAFVSWSSTTSVKIIIHNQNCPTILPSARFPNLIPGIQLPNAPIASGQNATARIPSIPLTIEDKGGGDLVGTSLLVHMNFHFAGLKSVMLDNMELLGHVTEVNLAKQKEHYIEFICN